jgi:hypothetical protein
MVLHLCSFIICAHLIYSTIIVIVIIIIIINDTFTFADIFLNSSPSLLGRDKMGVRLRQSYHENGINDIISFKDIINMRQISSFVKVCVICGLFRLSGQSLAILQNCCNWT